MLLYDHIVAVDGIHKWLRMQKNVYLGDVTYTVTDVKGGKCMHMCTAWCAQHPCVHCKAAARALLHALGGLALNCVVVDTPHKMHTCLGLAECALLGIGALPLPLQLPLAYG